jgi:arylsulfatase A-like enzyme
LTDLLTNKAINIINQSGDQPFFLYLAHTAMHRGNDDNPLPAKDQDLALYDFITYNPDRRRYAAMVKSLDENVGRLIESLKASGKLDDTLIVFTTDNGGPTMVKLIHPNTASNYPLRGLKGLTWEGGIRVNAMVYASWLPSGVVRNDYFHVTDWLQTLTTLADSNIRVDRVLDGMDLSNMIIKGTGPFRKEVETIDPIYQTTSFIRNDFKLMNSSYAPLNGLLDTWLGTNQNADRLSDSYSDIVLSSKVAVAIGKLNDQRIRNIRAGLKVTCTNKVVTCNVLAAPCLFNIRNDPCERENLADDPNYADIFEDMQNKLSKRVADVAPALNQPTDPLSNPAYHNGIWTWWQENTPAFQTSFGKYAKTW